MDTATRTPTQLQILALYAIREERPEDISATTLQRIKARGWATDHTGLWQLTIDGESALDD